MKDETIWLSLDHIAEEFDNVVVANFATTTKHCAVEGKIF